MANNNLTTELHWECNDCKKSGLWFGANDKITTTNNGSRHAERFGHTTYMTQRQAGFVDGAYFTSTPERV